MGIEVLDFDFPEVVAVYARVSSDDQKSKGDLIRQKARLLEHCVRNKYNVEYILEEVVCGRSCL